MSTVVLVRHGRSTANTSGVLAGRTAGVQLDEIGREQVARVGQRLSTIPLAGVVSSPLERCRQTAEAILGARADAPAAPVEPALVECDYGDWQGRKLSELTTEELWSTVQNQPSAATFPGGESLAAMQARAVEAIRRHDAAFEAEHGPQTVWVAVSHGDLIKAILADALGMHLDLFQRIGVDPASVSIVSYGPARPHVVTMNGSGGDLAWLNTPRDSSAAVTVGGGSGPPTGASPQP